MMKISDQKYVPTQPPGGIDIEDVANQWEKLLAETSDEELFQRLIDATEKFNERHPGLPPAQPVPEAWYTLLERIKEKNKSDS